MTRPLTFAIPKGRILDEALPLLAKAGIEPEAEFHDKKSRALVFGTNQPHISLIRVRAFDVATFVAHGAAQLGIVGSDVVDEFDYSELYAPVDLGIGTPRGTGCALVQTVTTAADLAAQIRAWRSAGVHCVSVSDAGRLSGDVAFAVRIGYFE